MLKNKLTKETVIKSFRLSKETLKSLQELTKKVNSKLNVRVSANRIVELLIQDAAKDNGNKVLNIISKP
jgi:RNA recognition motif-containing protein